MTYRILSLDGGGTWALLQAMALKELYPGKGGHAILADFDMAVANSGGAIVLAGLMLDRSPDDCIRLFSVEANRKAIFKKNSVFERLGALFKGHRYDAGAKVKGLERVLGDGSQVRMDRLAPIAGRSGKPLAALITAFDYDRRRAEFLRNFETGMKTRASPIRLVDAVHASTNAPVLYFDKPARCDYGEGAELEQRRYWDGAIGGYNNPMLAGIVEALALGHTPAAIEIRSIGTGATRLAPHRYAESAPTSLVEARPRSSFARDLVRVAGAINDDPPDAASYTAYFALGHGVPPADPATGRPKVADSGRIVRLNAMVQPVWNEVERRWETFGGLTLEEFEALAGLEMDVTEHGEMQQIVRLGQLWLAGSAPNQPVRADNDKLTCLLGDPTFAAARARW